jgi:ribosomal protein L32
MAEGEVLNADRTAYPLFHAVLYGDRIATAKLSKRLSCAVKHLPLRICFSYEYDTSKAVEKGIAKDPTLVLEGKIFLEGLVEAEVITEMFKKLVKEKRQRC